MTDPANTPKKGNFLTDIIEADLAKGRNQGRVVTRFPPEPNGFLHIGHSKSILLNAGLARQFGGQFHLRFDDTNPTTEETHYVESIQADVRWLGGDWGTHLYFASDYFAKMYEQAERLVREGNAYVDSQSVEAIREGRGSFEKPGVDSPFRTRSVAENLELFARMRAGGFKDGEAVLRAKIDMTHPNVLMRDPLLYRIRHAHHHRSGDAWCIYPMYDFAHPLEDAFEGITHSICTLEFESNRELYDWVLDRLGPWDPRPRQYEFARLALGYTVMSKRKLLQLVQEKRVSGWDDPRMPTVAGMRRRGVTAEALRDFADRIGVAKNNSLVDIGKLEFSIRSDLEQRAPRAFAVVDPLPLTITNWPAGKTESITLPWWPGEVDRAARGVRDVPFSGELLIEREDFADEPPAGWKRLAPGAEVRLMGAYVVRCDEVVRGSDGTVTALRCTYDAATAGGEVEGGRKVSGTLHWVDAKASVAAPVRLYDRLFTVEQPDADGDFLRHLNAASLREMPHARVEPALAKAEAGAHYQFVRQGYFFVDPVDSRPGAPVFHRTIGLKDNWARNAEAPAARPKRDKPVAAREDAEEARRIRASAREKMLAEHPEMATRYQRFTTLGLGADEAEVLARDGGLAGYFDAALVSAPDAAKAIARWLLNEVTGRAKDTPWTELRLAPAGLAKIVTAVEGGALTTAAAKSLLATLIADGGDVDSALTALAAEKAQGAGGLELAIARVLEKQAAEVARYRGGESKLFAVLLGAVMRETKGSADAAAVKTALTKAL